MHSELNEQGLHLLRCTLAERVVDARRKDAGVTSHEDYESFRENGYLIKDFSTMNSPTVTTAHGQRFSAISPPFLLHFT